jgi:hypothetical protein
MRVAVMPIPTSGRREVELDSGTEGYPRQEWAQEREGHPGRSKSLALIGPHHNVPCAQHGAGKVTGGRGFTMGSGLGARGMPGVVHGFHRPQVIIKHILDEHEAGPRLRPIQDVICQAVPGASMVRSGTPWRCRLHTIPQGSELVAPQNDVLCHLGVLERVA